MSPEEKAQDQSVPHDALERDNADLEDSVIDATNHAPGSESGGDNKDGEHKDKEPPKNPNALKTFARRFNVYFLGFLLVTTIGAIVVTVTYLNSRKAPVETSVPSQTLTADELQALSSSDATVGNSAQTLTIQGNAIFNGNVLMRSDLAIAGNLQIGGTFNSTNLTISGTSNLNDTQINSLQVAQSASVQGDATVGSLSVAGASSFSGPLTANQITVNRLIFSGNGVLQIPNHLAFTGATPARTINPDVLGAGGTSSLNGSDTSGTINISTGSNPTSGCFVTVRFAQQFSGSPHVIVTPFGSGGGSLQWYVNKSNTQFSICTNNAAPGNSTFGFDYFVAG